MPDTAAESARRAMEILRTGDTFQWYVIPLLALVAYVYANEAQRKNWSIVYAGLALWGVDWFNEIWNALLFHFNEFAPAWGAPGDTAFLLLVGLNIEICFMFAILGIVAAKLLPADRKLKILGLPNRLFLALANSIFCIVVEIGLNHIGALTWEHSWWCARFPWLLLLFGYLPFFVVAFWVHDMKTSRAQAAAALGILGFDAACLIIFAGILKWI